MKRNAISWFELQASDLNRARTFYEKILGEELIKIGEESEHVMWMFPCDEGHNGIGGAICSMPNCSPGEGGTLVYLNVDGKLDEVIARIPSAGGEIHQPKMTIPHGFIAIFKDSEGNFVGLHSPS